MGLATREMRKVKMMDYLMMITGSENPHFLGIKYSLEVKSQKNLLPLQCPLFILLQA
jgi:hypothetical protein